VGRMLERMRRFVTNPRPAGRGFVQANKRRQGAETKRAAGWAADVLGVLALTLCVVGRGSASAGLRD
jgi:hypothetical protein